ncbi:hypothetical protein MNV49_007326 [Pseudohyphozyma bogoriensis]|nr:hypothetical protein MNV49_007326 [Pseudohyphozyma bogoriensis]
MSPQTLYTDLKHIKVTLDDSGIALLELNRPEQRNAFSNPMKDALVEVLGRLDAEDKVKVIVLAGAPNKGNAFSAGADLSEGDFSAGSGINDAARNMNEHRDGGGQMTMAALRSIFMSITRTTRCPPGITMTLPFDIRVAWKDAKIGFVFGKRGIVPEAASSYFLPKLIGHSRALELFMTSRILPASSPTLSLLFSSLHPTPEATVEAALSLAKEIATNNSPISMALTKALVWRGKDSPEEQHLLDSKAMFVAGNTMDSKEGVLAFKEKREAKFPATVPKDLPTEFFPWFSLRDIRDIRRSKL